MDIPKSIPIPAGKTNTEVVATIAQTYADAVHPEVSSGAVSVDDLQLVIESAIRDAFEKLMPTFATTFDPPPEPRLPPDTP